MEFKFKKGDLIYDSYDKVYSLVLNVQSTKEGRYLYNFKLLKDSVPKSGMLQRYTWSLKASEYHCKLITGKKAETLEKLYG